MFLSWPFEPLHLARSRKALGKVLFILKGGLVRKDTHVGVSSKIPGLLRNVSLSSWGCRGWGCPPSHWSHLSMVNGSSRGTEQLVERQLLSLPSCNSWEMCLILHVAKGKATKLRKDKGGINSKLMQQKSLPSPAGERTVFYRHRGAPPLTPPSPGPQAFQMWGTTYSNNDDALHFVGEKPRSSFFAVK